MDKVASTPHRRRRRRPLPGRVKDPWDKVRDGLLVVVVVGSVLAIGTVHVPALLAVSALALIGATLEIWALRRVPWPAVGLAALALFSAVQALALPASWVKNVSPVSADTWLRCLLPFGEPALSHFPLSVDAGASIAEALKWLTYAAVYIMAARMRSRRGSVWLALLLFGSATLITLITLLHGVANVGTLYGLYHPDFAAGRWNVGPLLNSNNLGGYAILGMFSGGGLLLSNRSPMPRLPVAIGLGVISVALCLSGSRGAVLSALMAGATTLAWLARARSKGSRVPLRSLALAMAPFVIGIGIAVVLGTSRDATELASLDVRRKVSVWLWSLPMIRDHALFGVGRGAFETAFSPYRRALDYDWSTVVSHAENFAVQWIAEWGVPVGLSAVVVIVGYVLREWYASRDDRLRFMVMTGLVALLVQNLADLGLEVPALAIAAVLALAAGERPATAPAAESTQRFGRLALTAATPALGLWLATFARARFPVELERREMSVRYRELAANSADARARFRVDLRNAVLRHPGESFFPLLGALVALRASDDDALGWSARALELGPTNGPVHLVLAQLLHRHGANAQAMLHLRLAAQYDRTLMGLAGNNAASWAPSLELLLQAIPTGPLGEGMLLDACAKVQERSMKVDCFRRASARAPYSVEAAERLAEILLAVIQAGQPPCEPARVQPCAEEAEQALQKSARREPQAWGSNYLMAKLLAARGDFLGAAQLLTRTCPPTAEGDACWDEALTTAIKSHSDSVISSAADAFGSRPCAGSEACANMFATLAARLEAGGQAALSNTFYTKAAESDPSAERWIKVAEHATQARLYGVARTALGRADRSPDSSIASRAHAELLRQSIAANNNDPL